MRAKTVQLNHRNFFTLCEELRNRREVLTTKKPTLTDLAAELSEKLKLPISAHAIRNAQDATNIKWNARVRASTNVKNNRLRTLASIVKETWEELQKLVAELGKTPTPVPERLTALLRYLNGSHPGSATQNGHTTASLPE